MTTEGDNDNDGVEIRTLTTRDLPGMAAVLKEAFQSKRTCLCLPATESVAELTRRYSKYPPEKMALGAVAILSSSEVVVGCVQMSRQGLPVFPLDLHTCQAGEMYIEVIAVAAAARGKGVGSKLLAWCEATAVQQNMTHLSLEVLNGNRAIGLYERMGFQTKEHEEVDACDGCCDACFTFWLFGRPYGCCSEGWGSVVMIKQLAQGSLTVEERG